MSANHLHPSKDGTSHPVAPASDCRELEVFCSVGKALTSTLNLSEVLAIIMEKMRELFKPADWSLLLYDEERRQLRFEIVIGENTESLQGSWLPVDRGIAGWVVRHGEAVISADVQNDPRFDPSFDAQSGFVTRNIVAMPLISKGRILGVLELINVLDNGPFSETDIVRLATLADFAAIAIENARAVQRIRELTVTDDVTGLNNARYLQQALEQEFSRSKRYGTPLSVIFLDIDFFKHINDTYGHLVGSDVLRETATILRENLRATDIATRYGGDEFVLILPETSQAEARIVAERCRNAINAHTFGERHGAACRITASFGIATIPDDTQDKIDLIRLADQAMYYVKEHGRHNIAVAAILKQV